ncbi:MAG: hypothetical protein GMKNLPBB_01540 [Myxococcota bacterium]|nr:hypothetical protein [Myxococcota bacterium]
MKLRMIWTGAVLGLALAAAVPVRAAQITEVADSFYEDDDIFDASLRVRYEFLNERVQLNREVVQYSDRLKTSEYILARDLNASTTWNSVWIDAEFGVYKDLSLNVRLPITTGYSRSYSLAQDIFIAETEDGLPYTNSSLINDMGDLQSPTQGDLRESPQPGDPPRYLPRPPFDQSRRGFGDMEVGLRWNPLNHDRNPYHSTLLLAFDYRIPTGSLAQPGNQNIGMGVHFLTWTLAFSKRYAFAEPYISLHYTHPVPSKNRVEIPGRGASADIEAVWRPGMVTGLAVGVENTLYKSGEDGNLVTLDARFIGRWTGQSESSINPVSDALFTRTVEEQYLTAGGMLGLRAELARYIGVNISGTLAHNLNHFLTFSDFGENLPGGKNDRIDMNSTERSGFFHDKLDQVGRRVRADGSLIIGVSASIGVLF